MSQATTRRWIPALAGYRALAALAVFAFHIVSLDPPSGGLARWITPLGNAAVTVFFTLSGFLIYQPFARWAFGTGPPVAAGRFALKRAVRILPLYWVVLTVHLFRTGGANDYSIGDLLTAYALIQNFRGALVFVPPFVAWSLSIELWFSFILPLLAAPLRIAGRGRSDTVKLRIQLLGIVLMASVAIAFRVWALTGPSGSGRILWMPAYLDWFAGGLFLAIWTTYLQGGRRSGQFAKYVPSAGYLAALGFVSYWAVTQLDLPGGFIGPTRFQTHSQFLLQGLMSLALVAAAVLPSVDLGIAGKVLSSRLLGWLGAVSYGIYLIHPVVSDEIVARSPDLALSVLAPIALLITLVAAFVLHRLVELPAAELGERLSSRQPRPSAAALSSGGSRLRQARRATVLTVTASLLAFASPILSRPGVYVADARYEVFVDPLTRLARLFTVWDSTRDLGRPAEEFWPAVTLVSAALSQARIDPWLIERVWHGLLLSIALAGAMGLSRTLAPGRLGRAAVVGLLYAFGPFSAVYLVPSTLYVSYAIAPWLVVAVIMASRGRRPFAWAGVVALLLFAAGNADPPGLVFAAVPAAAAWIGLAASRPDRRRSLLAFAGAATLATGLASAAMLTKTAIGAQALSHRLTETEAASVVAATSSFTESIRGMGFWVTYFRLGPTNFRSQQALFLTNGLMIVVTVVPVVIGVAALAWRRSDARVMALLWIIIGTALMVGPHPIDDPSPYGQFLLDLYERSELAFGFRSTHKAGVIVSLGVAVLGGWGLTDVAQSSFGPRAFRRIPLLAVGALLLALTQPFWRTPLYDPAFTSVGQPSHWSELGDWFEANPPAGRVLVLPGSTNNGYQWGSVGDDLLDPIVPNRVVASNLPLSTPLGADLVAALDEQLTSPSYQPGMLADVAARLGITHVVIRNDLDWQRQGIAPPSALGSLRADPDLVLAASFGVPGSYQSAAPGFAPLPPIQVYRIGHQTKPSSVVIPANGQRRQLLVEGDASAVLRLSALGELAGGHPVRFAGMLDGAEMAELAPDVALVVLTDTNRALDRRINYYGFEFAPADDPTLGNRWLPEFSVDSTTTMTVREAKVGSTVDRWLLGDEHAPTAALDGNTDSSWLVPILADVATATWWLEFEEPKEISVLTIELLDETGRVKSADVRIDGRPVAGELADEKIDIEIGSSVTRLEISFDEVDPGLAPIGLREVSIDGVDVVLSLPDRLSRYVKADAALGANLSGSDLLMLLGSDEPSAAPIRRTVELWRADDFTFSATIETSGETARCTTNVLSIDGAPVPVFVSPGPQPGRATLGQCPSEPFVQLSAGPHVIDVVPPPGSRMSIVRFDSSVLERPLVERRRIDLEAGQQFVAGDLLITPYSFDERWLLESNRALRPIALDGQTSWMALDGAVLRGPVFGPDAAMRRSLDLTAAGLALALFLIASGKRTGTLFEERPTAKEGAAEERRIGRKPGWVWLLVDGMAVAVAWAFVGWPGGAGALAALMISRRRDPRAVYLLAAMTILGAVVLVAAPVVEHPGILIDPTSDDSLVRIAIGALVSAAVMGSASREVDDAVPGGNFS